MDHPVCMNSMNNSLFFISTLHNLWNNDLQVKISIGTSKQIPFFLDNGSTFFIKVELVISFDFDLLNEFGYLHIKYISKNSDYIRSYYNMYTHTYVYHS